MVILLTCLYKIRVAERLKEIQYVFENNLKNTFIKEIVVFFEKYDAGIKESKEYGFLLSPKIKIIDCKERQKYSLLFDYALSLKSGNNKFIIANADIIFDKTINRINEIDFTHNTMCMLTRWEILKKRNGTHLFKLAIQENKLESWSFDCLIFDNTLKIDTSKLDIIVGISGCDSYLLQKIREQRIINIINPCLDVRTFHFHFEDTDRISSPNDFTYWQMQDYDRNAPGVRISTTDGITTKTEYILTE